MFSWIRYIKFKCFEERIGSFDKCFSTNVRIMYLFELLFWMTGIGMCYITIIIFYSNPELFNFLERPDENNDKNILFPAILFIPVCLFCIVSRKMIFNCSSNKQYIIYTLIIYLLTIFWSNILSLLIFRYITTTLYVLVVPFFSFMFSILITVTFDFCKWSVKLLIPSKKIMPRDNEKIMIIV